MNRSRIERVQLPNHASSFSNNVRRASKHTADMFAAADSKRHLYQFMQLALRNRTSVGGATDLRRSVRSATDGQCRRNCTYKLLPNNVRRASKHTVDMFAAADSKRHLYQFMQLALRNRTSVGGATDLRQSTVVTPLCNWAGSLAH